ncbi:hypothetical protein [Streptomyces sp. NPDC056291]|uniref:hypothetical protein n=1 Tax=unclassified Streptomyces TaxID=2593676 RepID=UPI0035DE279B
MTAAIDVTPVSLDGASTDPVIRQVVRSRLVAITDQMWEAAEGAQQLVGAEVYRGGLFLGSGW